MWRKTLVAAAVAASLPGRPVSAAEDAPVAPAEAGDAPDNPKSATLLERVVVEADRDDGLNAQSASSSSKMQLSIRETPQSVSVITQESLRDRQVIDFGQALEMAAGVNQFSGTGAFSGQAGFGFNETTIRGIHIDDVNDIREDGFINSSYFAMPDMALYDRIEIIKGPNSVVYGRGSAGGLINRVRKKPLQDAQADVELTAGAYNTYRLDVDATGPLASNPNILGRLVAAYSDEGSFIQGVRTKRTLFAPSIELKLDTGTRILAEGLYQRDNYIPNPGMPLRLQSNGHWGPADIDRSEFIGQPNARENRWNIYSGSLEVEQTLSDEWLANLRINRNKTITPIKQDRYSYGLSDAGDTAMVRNDFHIDRDIWAGELKLAGDLKVANVPVKVAAGAEFSDNSYHRRGAYAYSGYANIYLRDFHNLPAPQDLELTPGFDYRDYDKTQGYYLQLQVKPLDRLGILGGFRYDETYARDYAITTSSLSEKRDSAVSGRVGLTYELTSNISAYGVWARSFSPTLFSRDINGNVLDPETGKIYEVGTKTQWLDNRFSVNAAVYRIDRQDIPVSVPTPPGEPGYSVSSGVQRSQGFEVEANGQPLPGWNLSLAYNHLRSKFLDPNDSFYGAVEGGSAPWQVGFFSTYQLQSGPLQGLGFGGTVFSIGERGLSTYQQGLLDGYTRVDLNLFYKPPTAPYDVSLTVRNLTNRRYIEGADRSGGLANFGSPTAWLLNVRYKLIH